MAATSRPRDARPRERLADLDVPERHEDRIARQHAPVRGNSLRLQSRYNGNPNRPSRDCNEDRVSESEVIVN